MSEQEILFSIIIPHYNIVKGLERLLSGIAGYDDVQVIVVDDRSDSGLEAFSRVREMYRQRGVLFLENNGVKGAGSCRNLGMRYAVGKWILFSDADDFFTKEFHNILLEYADSHADLIYFSPVSVFADTLAPAKRHIRYVQNLKAYQEDPSHAHELRLKYDQVSPWSKMYLREYLENHSIRFEEIMYSNDSCFSIKSAFYAASIEVCAQTIYCLTDREESLTKNESMEVRLMRLQAFIRRSAFLKKNLPAEDWRYLDINMMSRLLIIFQQGAGIRTLLLLVWQCVRAGIPFIDWSKVNKKTFLSTFFRIYRANRAEQK